MIEASNEPDFDIAQKYSPDVDLKRFMHEKV